MNNCDVCGISLIDSEYSLVLLAGYDGEDRVFSNPHSPWTPQPRQLQGLSPFPPNPLPDWAKMYVNAKLNFLHMNETLSPKAIHDKFHNPFECWFDCEYGDDRSYD